MISDKIFKALLHNCKGYNCSSKGSLVEQGYKPDYVMKKDNNYIILESENSSSRKTFVGGMIKAAHFLVGEKTGILIFIIVPKPNTTALSIARHLKPYLNWISDKTNLKEVYVIEAGLYYKEKELLPILSKAFFQNAVKV